MGFQVNVARWKCPHQNCNKVGKKWMSQWKARKFGKIHLRNYHKDYKSEPILDILRKEDV